MHTPFAKLRSKTVLEYLDKYPNASSHSLARIIFKNEQSLYDNSEQVRQIIRIYRGAHGETHRNIIKNRKHFKNEIQPT